MQYVEGLNGETARRSRVSALQQNLHESCRLWRGCTGELAFFEEDAGVVEGQATVFKVEPACDFVREVLRLGKAEKLAYDIEGRGAGLN